MLRALHRLFCAAKLYRSLDPVLELFKHRKASDFASCNSNGDYGASEQMNNA